MDMLRKSPSVVQTFEISGESAAVMMTVRSQCSFSYSEESHRVTFSKAVIIFKDNNCRI